MRALGQCHGFTGRPDDPYCYHPGPWILPVWASDLLAWIVVTLLIGVTVLAIRRMDRSLSEKGKKKDGQAQACGRHHAAPGRHEPPSGRARKEGKEGQPDYPTEG